MLTGEQATGQSPGGCVAPEKPVCVFREGSLEGGAVCVFREGSLEGQCAYSGKAPWRGSVHIQGRLPGGARAGP